jgi:hypothetical protein
MPLTPLIARVDNVVSRIEEYAGIDVRGQRAVTRPLPYPFDPAKRARVSAKVR